jgi:hypothetical protein
MISLTLCHIANQFTAALALQQGLGCVAKTEEKQESLNSIYRLKQPL